MTLARVLDAVRIADYAAARDAAIEAWRERRAPELAVLAAVLAERAPDALSAQLAGLVTPRVASSLANLEALAGVDDPRLSGLALDALVQLPFTARSATPFLRALIQTVERLRDPRLQMREPAIRVALETRIALFDDRRRLTERVARTARHLPAVRAATPVELALEAELAQLIAPLSRGRRSEDELLAEIYAHPEDDGPRLVYADVLTERGDLRGELIALQLARGDGEPTEREKWLLAKHGKKWLGALAPVLSWRRDYSKTAFRRGFVAVADFIWTAGKKLEPLLRDPAWATVEKLEGEGRHPELLIEAPLPALRVLTVMDRELLATLAARGKRLTGVRRIWLRDPDLDPEAFRAVLPGIEVAVIYAREDRARDLAAFARLGIPHLEVTNNWFDERLAERLAEFEAYLATLVGAPAELARLTLAVPHLRMWEEPPPVELRRGADGRYQRV